MRVKEYIKQRWLFYNGKSPCATAPVCIKFLTPYSLMSSIKVNACRNQPKISYLPKVPKSLPVETRPWVGPQGIKMIDLKQIWLSCTAIHQFGSFSTFCRLTRSKVSHHGKYCFWHTFSRTSDHYQLNADASFLPFHFIIIGLQLSVSHVLHYLVWTCDDCFLWWDMTKCSC